MSEPSHNTKGPWVVGGTLLSNGRTTIARLLWKDPKASPECKFTDYDRDAPESFDEVEANSKLIRKAWLIPEMIEALHLLLRTRGVPHYADEFHADKVARDVLAKV